MSEVSLGQVWRDKDKRSLSGRRYVRVDVLDDAENGYAWCRQVFLNEDGSVAATSSGKPTRIRTTTLRSRFELVSA
jgi:hypothetical protein